MPRRCFHTQREALHRLKLPAGQADGGEHLRHTIRRQTTEPRQRQQIYARRERGNERRALHQRAYPVQVALGCLERLTQHRTRAAGGPHESEQHPDQRRLATEQLLTDRSAHEITIRDITRHAGANVAAVGYHFGGKDELITATIRAAIDQMTSRQRAAIAALPADADLTSLVRAWLAPALQTLHGHPDGTGSWQLLARSLQSGSPLLAAVIAEGQHDVTPLLDRLSALLPHLSADELAWRHGATLGLAGFVGSPGGAILCSPGDGLAAERFLAYVIAALSAPAVSRTSA